MTLVIFFSTGEGALATVGYLGSDVDDKCFLRTGGVGDGVLDEKELLKDPDLLREDKNEQEEQYEDGEKESLFDPLSPYVLFSGLLGRDTAVTWDST